MIDATDVVGSEFTFSDEGVEVGIPFPVVLKGEAKVFV